MTIWPPILHAPFFVLLFWWVAMALGDRFLRIVRLKLVTLSLPERAFISLTVGAGLIQYVPYVLAGFGKLTPAALRGTSVVLLAVLAPDMVRLARRVAGEFRRRSRQSISTASALWATALVVLLAMLLFQALALRPGGDDDGYHLSAPKRWLEDGRLSYLASYTHTNASMGFEMLYTIALAVWNPIGAKMLHYTAGLYALWGVWLCGKRLGHPLSGTLAVSALMIATPFCDLPVLFGVAFVDLATCWMVTAGILCWLVWYEDTNPRALACLSLCIGFAGSFKLTALTVGLAWAVALLVEARRRRVGIPQAAGWLARFGALAALPVLPWLYRNWNLTGNPLYPMGSSIVPTRDWSPEQAQILGRYVRYYAWGVGTTARPAEEARQIILGVTIALIGLGLGFAMTRIERRVLRSLLLIAMASTMATVSVTGLVFRYWLPGTICVVLVASALVIPRLVERLRRWAPAALAVLALLVHVRKDHDLARNVRLALGVRSLDEEYAADPLWRMWDYVNTKVPDDGAILVAAFYTTFGSSSFGCFYLAHPCYVTDSHLQTRIDLRDWEAFLRSLESARIRYVLVADRQFSPDRHGFVFRAGQNEYPFSRRLVDDYGRKLYEIGHLQFYSIDPAAIRTDKRNLPP